MTAPPPPTLRVPRRAASTESRSAEGDFPAAAEWHAAPTHALALWSGAPDPLAANHGPSTFRLLWDARAIFLHARVPFATLHVDPARSTHEKSHGLWETDVVELFLSRGEAPLPYAEVEGSPLGQWLDYFIERPREQVDRQWRSGARVRGALDEGHFTVEIALPWRGLGAAPHPGLALRANVYVAQGPPEQRRYLAFAPTLTPSPDFHVPDRFAYLVLG